MNQFFDGPVSDNDQPFQVLAKLLSLLKRDTSQRFKQCTVCYEQRIDSSLRQSVSGSDFVRVQRKSFEAIQLELLQTCRAAVGTLLPQVVSSAGE